MNLNLSDCYVAVESRDTPSKGGTYRIWQQIIVPVRRFVPHPRVREHPGEVPSESASLTESPSRKRASLPRPERMVQAAPTFGISPSEKRTLDLITDHPMIPREHLANWLGVSEGRVSQR